VDQCAWAVLGRKKERAWGDGGARSVLNAGRRLHAGADLLVSLG